MKLGIFRSTNFKSAQELKKLQDMLGKSGFKPEAAVVCRHFNHPNQKGCRFLGTASYCICPGCPTHIYGPSTCNFTLPTLAPFVGKGVPTAVITRRPPLSFFLTIVR